MDKSEVGLLNNLSITTKCDPIHISDNDEFFHTPKLELSMSFSSTNGKEATINKELDGSTYPG
jgi:hypothetical protein